MTQTNAADEMTLTDTSLDFDDYQQERGNGASINDPSCLTHRAQYMTATWGN